MVAERVGFATFPVTKNNLELFGGYLKVADVYANPALHIHAMVRLSKMRGHPFLEDVTDLVTSLSRGLPQEEQAEPYTLSMW